MGSGVFLTGVEVDIEMQDAINELKQAQMMFNEALNKWRTDESIARITAAHFRIEAIRNERMDATKIGRGVINEVN